MKQLPKITDKQLDILLHLYKFYFLNTNQFQKLFHHKKPQTVQKWLKDLKDKKYITTYDTKQNQFIANTEPNIYHLTKLARQKLKHNEKCDISVLDRVYQTKKLSSEFVENCVFLADIYLSLESQIKHEEKLHFSTKANLVGFDYFPLPLPDAYIANKTPEKTKRSFLILLNSRILWRVLDKRILGCVEYSNNNHWADYSPDPLPSFLIICPNESTKKHIYKTIANESPITSFYLTTKDTIKQSGFTGNSWQKVEEQKISRLHLLLYVNIASI